MSNKIKTFVANYLATFLEGEYVEAEGDIRHYPKEYTFSKTTAVEKPPERQGGFLPSDKIPLFKEKPSAPANKEALAASQKGIADQDKAASDKQAATTEGGKKRRLAQTNKYEYPVGKQTTKARYDANRRKFRALSVKAAGPASFERKGQIESPGKEQYFHPSGAAKYSNATTVAREPQPAYATVANRIGRSNNTGARVIKSQETKWKQGGPQGDVVATAPGMSSLDKNYQPTIRANIPASPHVGNAVANALIRATKDPEKRKLLSLQKKASIV